MSVNYQWLKKIEISACVVMLSVSFIAVFILNNTTVQGNSMQKTYNDKDRVLTALYYPPIKPNDIIVFYSDGDGSKVFIPNMFNTIWQTRSKSQKSNENYRDLYIKRVIAMPGDIVEIIDKKVYIANTPERVLVPIDENYVNNSWVCQGVESKESVNMAKIIVPDDSYFVLGDNRGCSEDSRSFGSVKKQAILGKVILKL